MQRTEEECEEIKLKKNLNFSSFITIKPASKKRRSSQSRALEQKSRITELDLQYENINKILRCSNATPIRCFVSSRYACSYCFEQFHDPKELKGHTLSHSDNAIPDFLKIKTLSRYIVYMDISNLKCKICDLEIDDLDSLTNHLKTNHNETVHELKNHIVPFKFGDDSDELACVECSKTFDDILTLQEHTTGHYKNYKCEFCEAAFLNRSMMIQHKKDAHNVDQKVKYQTHA
ncbi:zinc finger protein 93-like [Pectinophora gossypiella]|uniref:zinc finger protein 93-like n=1 Tax=Pectinophora gossypiella TaxID=13191 RepID=UPI00214E1812|nr:zinc finger protein 93-like [Pectinophora gossypiella]